MPALRDAKGRFIKGSGGAGGGIVKITVDYKDTTRNVSRAIDKGMFKSFRHAAASIRKTAIDSVQVTKETIGWITTRRLSKKGKRIRARIYRPSPVGTPVHSHRNKGFVRRGIRFGVHKKDGGAVIGFSHATYGDVMKVHEHGGVRKGQKFDKRPTMAIALQKSENRITTSFRGSITQTT